MEKIILLFIAFAATTFASYADNSIHKYKAPLYWSVYEYCYENELNGQPNKDFAPGEWDKIIDWVATDLKPYGYDMICTDGFIPILANNGCAYMTHYGSMSLKELVSKCKAKGLKVGVYDNPLWIHGWEGCKVPGTNYTLGSLNIPNDKDWWFKWAVPERPGCKEFIDGFFKHYKELGIEYIRIDFLSWFEDGYDRNLGTVGRGYGRESYARALKYISEAADKYGIFISLVMPHLYNDAELEKKYGNMVRIVADTTRGGWNHCSAHDRGRVYGTWPNCMNMFDGFTYWSRISGRDNVILDGDFLRLNTFATDAEKETVISLQLMAGGPVTVADQYYTIGDNLRFYQNSEMLELNKDRFVGRPLSDNLNNPNNQIWYGQMSNGDYVIGLFNRDDYAKDMRVNFSDLGIAGVYKIRDLWLHHNEGYASSLSATIPAHGCKIVKLTQDECERLYIVGEATPYGYNLDEAQALLAVPGNPGIFSGTIYLKGGKDKKFKFLEEQEWGGLEYGLPIGSGAANGEIRLTSGFLDEGYDKLYVTAEGNYFITIDTKNLKGAIKRSEYQAEKIRNTSLFLVGNATPGGWVVADATPLYQSVSAPFEYQTTVALRTEDEGAKASFKIAKALRGAASWNPDFYYFRDAADEGKISDDGTDDLQWSVSDSGSHTVTVNTNDKTISISKSDNSGVDGIAIVEETCIPPTYYNLMGQKVNSPAQGIFIKVCGNKVSKVIRE